jgi:hypothetical protein
MITIPGTFRDTNHATKQALDQFQPAQPKAKIDLVAGCQQRPEHVVDPGNQDLNANAQQQEG